MVKTKQKTTKNVTLYKKITKFELVGKQEDLQTLMHDVHKFIGEHKLMLGGLSKRKIDVKHKSSKPIKLFEGNYD